MTPTFFDTLLGYVSSFVTSLFSVGSSLITWITTGSNAIVLIPLVMMIVVFFVSAIRKLIKGV